MRLTDDEKLLEQVTVEQFRQNLVLLQAKEIEMPRVWVLELCDTIEALQQENEPLKIANRAMEQSMQYWLCNHSQGKLTQHNIDLKLQVRQLQAQRARMREALESTLKRVKMIELPQNYEIFHAKAIEAIAAIDKIGGQEDA